LGLELREISGEMVGAERSRVAAMWVFERFLRFNVAMAERFPQVRCWLEIRAWIRF
jgi:hypothetical protein